MRGKVALITGASQGIGLAIAQELARTGCDVVITARTQSKLDAAARTLKGNKTQVLPAICDVREPEQVQSLFAAVRKKFHRLDILVNNAGISHPNSNVSQMPFATWREVMETNLDGMFLVTQAALSLMQQGSTIVNNLSIAAKRAFPGASAYAASKHGALGFTKTLREELRGQGIRVIALLPGAADTAIWDAFWPDAPRKKMMSAETIARAVVNALNLPEETTVEELTIMPSAGVL